MEHNAMIVANYSYSVSYSCFVNTNQQTKDNMRIELVVASNCIIKPAAHFFGLFEMRWL